MRLPLGGNCSCINKKDCSNVIHKNNNNNDICRKWCILFIGPPDPLKTGFVHHCSTIVCVEGMPERLLIESRDDYNNLCTFPSNVDPNEVFVIKIQRVSYLSNYCTLIG